MNPLPYYFDSFNRNAILVRAKKPFFDWLNNLFEDEDPIVEKEENNIYLIREMGTNDEVKHWVKNNFEDIFENELNDWCSDESAWPMNRTYKMFSEWFDIEVHSMILDLEDFPVTKD